MTISTAYVTKRTKGRGGRVVTTRQVDGIKAEIELGAPPKPGIMYSLRMRTADCPRYDLTFVYWNGRPRETQLEHRCGGQLVYEPLEPAEMRGSKVVIHADAEQAYFDPGMVFNKIDIFTRNPLWSPTGRVQVPQYDYASTTLEFRYG